MSLPQVLLWTAGLLALAVLLGLLARRIHLPVTVVLAVVGLTLSALAPNLPMHEVVRGEAFERILVFVFLPALVFAEARALPTRAFFRNLMPILVLAIPAVLVSTVVVGATLAYGLHVPLVTALLFGSLISATDPVAVVAIFRQLGVPERLLMLVEGESLLNDGVAIVLYNILLGVALGRHFSAGGAVLNFLWVFLGGALIGALLGVLVAGVLPWLDRLAAAALSVALAYGSYVLADEVLGVSGVMATAAAGLVISGMAPARAPQNVRHMWNELWDALSYVANALLFLMLGFAINASLLGTYLAPLLLTVLAVFVARALGVIPLVTLLERLAHLPKVGWRNEAVMIWGGLRGGVALALALALPEELAQRELLVALTGGVVLVTLLLNATTIGAVVRALGIDRPSRTDEFLAQSAQVFAVHGARRRLQDLDLRDAELGTELDRLEQQARESLRRLHLGEEEQRQVIIRRGFVVEHETYQLLRDAGLLPSSAALTLLDKTADQIEDVMAIGVHSSRVRQRERARGSRWLERLTAALPGTVTVNARELAYAEASARRLASRRTRHEIERFADLPNISTAALHSAQAAFRAWEEEAVVSLQELDTRVGHEQRELHRQQAEVLARAAARDELDALRELGLLSYEAVERACRQVERALAPS